MRKIHSLAGLLFLSACQTTPTVDHPRLTINTQPAFASVQEIGGNESVSAPLVLDIEGEGLRADNGCIAHPGFVATWPSGAQASTPPTIHLCDNRAGYQLTLDRPQNVAGLEADLEHADRQLVLQRQIQQQEMEQFLAEQREVQGSRNPGINPNNNHD